MIIVDNPITGKREKLSQAEFNSFMAQTNGAILKYVSSPTDLEKHKSHDQSSHGRRGGARAGYVGGKDLIKGDLSNPMLASDLEKFSYDDLGTGKRDETLGKIIKEQGFDGPAKIVNQEEFDEIDKAGGYTRFRGINEYTDSNGNKIEGAAITEQFAEGEYFPGIGIGGNGTYVTDNVDKADAFSRTSGSGGEVVQMVILPEAKIASYDQTLEVLGQMQSPSSPGGLDLGRIMAARGFDGYPSMRQGGKSDGSLVMLNRTAMAVLDPALR